MSPRLRVVALGGGCLLFLASWRLWVDASAFRESALCTDATVVDTWEDYESDHYAIVEFTPLGATEPLRVATAERSPAMGRTLPLLYDAANPRRTEVNSPIWLYQEPVLLAVFGVFLVLLAFEGRRKQADES